MACMSRTLLIIGAAVSLAGCSSQALLPLYSQVMYNMPPPETVKKIQIALRDRGYYASSIDGFP